MTDDAIRAASAQERLEAAAEMAGCTTEEMRAFLMILHDNGGSMHVDDFEREWLRRHDEEESGGGGGET